VWARRARRGCRRIVDQDLLAADADDHVTAETDPCLPECVDHGGQVVDLDREVVLSSRCRHGFVGAWPGPPGPPPGGLSSSRRSRRVSMAKVGVGCIRSSKGRYRQRNAMAASTSTTM
jgi:hypothetical protein